jgi:colicin import membrane protein
MPPSAADVPSGEHVPQVPPTAVESLPTVDSESPVSPTEEIATPVDSASVETPHDDEPLKDEFPADFSAHSAAPSSIEAAQESHAALPNTSASSATPSQEEPIVESPVVAPIDQFADFGSVATSPSTGETAKPADDLDSTQTESEPAQVSVVAPTTPFIAESKPVDDFADFASTPATAAVTAPDVGFADFGDVSVSAAPSVAETKTVDAFADFGTAPTASATQMDAGFADFGSVSSTTPTVAETKPIDDFADFGSIGVAATPSHTRAETEPVDDFADFGSSSTADATAATSSTAETNPVDNFADFGSPSTADAHINADVTVATPSTEETKPVDDYADFGSMASPTNASSADAIVNDAPPVADAIPHAEEKKSVPSLQDVAPSASTASTDDFADFNTANLADTKSDAPAANAEPTPAKGDDFADFGGSATPAPASADTEFPSFAAPESSTTAEATLDAPKNSEDDFASFRSSEPSPAASAAPAATAAGGDDDFGDFADFQSTGSSATAVASTGDDEFGDFGDFAALASAAATDDDGFSDFAAAPTTVQAPVTTTPVAAAPETQQAPAPTSENPLARFMQNPTTTGLEFQEYIRNHCAQLRSQLDIPEPQTDYLEEYTKKISELEAQAKEFAASPRPEKPTWTFKFEGTELEKMFFEALGGDPAKKYQQSLSGLDIFSAPHRRGMKKSGMKRASSQTFKFAPDVEETMLKNNPNGTPPTTKAQGSPSMAPKTPIKVTPAPSVMPGTPQQFDLTGLTTRDETPEKNPDDLGSIFGFSGAKPAVSKAPVIAAVPLTVLAAQATPAAATPMPLSAAPVIMEDDFLLFGAPPSSGSTTSGPATQFSPQKQQSNSTKYDLIAQDVLGRVPDLSFLHSKVLMPASISRDWSLSPKEKLAKAEKLAAAQQSAASSTKK